MCDSECKCECTCEYASDSGIVCGVFEGHWECESVFVRVV